MNTRSASRALQPLLFDTLPADVSRSRHPLYPPPLLKWIGSKHRVAQEIIFYFPTDFRTYLEPFLGSGAVLGALAPLRAVASDVLPPVMEIWRTLADHPERLVKWYKLRREQYQRDRKVTYEKIRARFNRRPNGADLLFLSRSCYGGVIRFRKDGYMSTPIGAHTPISPEAMGTRIRIWHERTLGVKFLCADFEETIDRVGPGDLVYCDPPYSDSQSILYGSQEFTLERLFSAIRRVKDRGAYVALSIDGNKKSGRKVCDIRPPNNLFRRSIFIHCGRSMLRRFQMGGRTLESEVVADRLLLTW